MAGAVFPPPPMPLRPLATAPLARPVLPGGAAGPEAAWKAAKSFEAMTLGELLKPMFDTVDTAHGAFGGGDAEDAWKPMLVTEIAKKLADAGGLGLAMPIYQQILRMQEQAGPPGLARRPAATSSRKEPTT